MLYVQPNDVKKWMGMLLVHRLVKRWVETMLDGDGDGGSGLIWQGDE